MGRFPRRYRHYRLGINPRGDIVGSYCDGLPCGASLNTNHGFLLNEGDFASFDFPGARFTRAFSINPRGDIAGTYQDFNGRKHGFLIRRDKDEVGDGNND